MVTLEQVRQLETKIGKAIDYVNRVKGENIRLQGELDGSRKRISELENTIQQFKEEQGRIEKGIFAALKRLDQLEDDMNQGFSDVQEVVAAAVPVADQDPLEPPAPVEGTAPPLTPSGELPEGDTLDGEQADEDPSQDSEETGDGELDIF
jgi:archaellum component FlaC